MSSFNMLSLNVSAEDQWHVHLMLKLSSLSFAGFAVVVTYPIADYARRCSDDLYDSFY